MSNKIEREQYRFENGSLFEYDAERKAYIHCFKNYYCNTKAKAIRAYENYENQE